MFILFVGYFSMAEGRLSPVLRWKSSTVSHGFPYIVSIYYIIFYLFVLKILGSYCYATHHQNYIIYCDMHL